MASLKIPTLTIGRQESPKDISLYLHIPFCSKKCPYCHFYVVKSALHYFKPFLEALKQEFFLIQPFLKGLNVRSIYLGGGTPSQLPPAEINSLLKVILNAGLTFSSDLEITMEGNPEDLSLEYLKALADSSVNRLSIGVQSLDETLLRVLNRQHDAKKAIQAIETAHKLGITNISIDLMYDLPSQSLSQWKETLSLTQKLPITHLSLYNLTLEPHTVFFKKKDELIPLIPNEEESVEFLNLAIESLEAMGLKRYEISAFAQSGFHSRHNTGYWLGRPFYGLGPSAFSYDGESRFSNIASLPKYQDRISHGSFATEFKETLDKEASSRELLAIRIRLLEGVNLKDFDLSQSCLKECDLLVKEGYLHQVEDHLWLSEKGLLFYDTVAERLI